MIFKLLNSTYRKGLIQNYSKRVSGGVIWVTYRQLTTLKVVEEGF
jgi:hypothetical protein